MALSWYVIQSATNMEDKVQSNIARAIIKKISDYELIGDTAKADAVRSAFNIAKDMADDVLLEEYLKQNVVLVPKEKVEEVRNGKQYDVYRKIFAGYLLIKMDYSDEMGILVRKTPRVAGFVGVAKDSKPVPISQSEVDEILRQVADSKEHARHRVEYGVGEKIRIIDGPFVDFNAVIEEVIYAKKKLRVNVQIFGRETAVELNLSQVEKLV